MTNTDLTEITPEEEERAKKVVEGARQARAAECLAKIELLCKECGATLVPYLTIVGGQIVDHGIRLEVVGKPNEVA